MPSARISGWWRIAIGAKGLLLLAVAAGFGLLAWRSFVDPSWAQRAFGVVLSWLGAFVGWASRLAFADALVGQALTETGVTALPSRKSGLSMRAPSGRYLEFVLWNPWPKLAQGARYTITFGRYSGIIVERPEVEAPQGAIDFS